MRDVIRTGRLELIAATPQLLDAEGDHRQLSILLNADIPANWPTPLYDGDARNFFHRVLTENPETAGWTSWYILLVGEDGAKTLAGAVGACGLPDPDGNMIIGYSMLDQFQRKGYATEALRGFIEWAAQNPDLRRVAADTFPHLVASIRVLEKIGFTPCGPGTEAGTIGFELRVQH
ncbi:MAG: GNAT family N-acetyltransferase [Candidatus Sumerlaeia bacterium]